MVSDAAGPLRYTVLYMAAEHLAALRGQQVVGVCEARILHYHNLAICSLSKALQDPAEAISDSTLPAILLMHLSTPFAADQDPMLQVPEKERLITSDYKVGYGLSTIHPIPISENI